MQLLVRFIDQFLTVVVLAASRGPPLLISKLISTATSLVTLVSVGTIDLIYFTLNLFLPQKPKGSVVAKGNQGYQGLWPVWQPPVQGVDSRSPCPYLNALANHGILNRSGRAISMSQIRSALRKSIGASWTLAFNTTNSLQGLYGKDTIDLGDLARHGVVEHDASVIRSDAYFQPDQGTPDKTLINELLSTASRPPSKEHPEGALSASDIAKFTKERLAYSKAYNPTFTGLSAFHTLFAGNNLALLLDPVDGDVKLLKTILLEERFPDGFETSFRQRLGYTNFDMELRTVEMLLRVF